MNLLVRRDKAYLYYLSLYGDKWVGVDIQYSTTLPRAYVAEEVASYPLVDPATIEHEVWRKVRLALYDLGEGAGPSPDEIDDVEPAVAYWRDAASA